MVPEAGKDLKEKKAGGQVARKGRSFAQRAWVEEGLRGGAARKELQRSSPGREGTGKLEGLGHGKAILARAGTSPQLREGCRGRAGTAVGRGDEGQGVAVAAGLR